jgi:trans-aconitate methyltransferase
MMERQDRPRPRSDRSAVRAYFDHRAAVYRTATGHGLWGWQRRREAQAVLTQAGRLAGRAALDLGCGAGFYAELLAAHGARPVVAVDHSAPMLSQITDPRIERITSDVATVTLPHRFDVIVVAGVLEFVDDASAVLGNARRHLADGGIIIVLLPPDNVAGRLYRQFHHSHGVEISLFGQTCLDDLAANAGLKPLVRHLVRPFSLVATLVAG